MMSRCIAVALMVAGPFAAMARTQEKVAPANQPGSLRRIEKHKGWTRAIVLSPDGWRLLTCGGNPDCAARVWDFVTGKELRRLEFDRGMTPAGSSMAAGP